MGRAVSGLVFFMLCTASSSSNGPSVGQPPASRATIYYVATDGNDSYDGLFPARQKGSRGPFRTLMRAAHAVRAGDTVRIKGGIYQASSSWMADGTEAQPITVTNFNGEAVILDGDDFKIPGGAHDVLLQIYGDWYTISNLEIRHSSGSGMAIHGNHCKVDNVYACQNWNSGIYMTGWYGLISGCRAYSNSMMNANAKMRIGWGFGISACRYPQYTTIRGCTSWENWGEGISTFESHHITIEDCVSYDNQCNFYLSDTQYCLFQRNLAYCTSGNKKQGYVTQANISLGDETHVPESSHNTVINNVALGGERNFVTGGRVLLNALVAHNTFVNAVDVGGIESTNVYFHAGNATGARFLNNIVLQEDEVTISHIEAKEIAFGPNCWSRRPLLGCRGPSDIIGDPKILKSGPIGPGLLMPEWFKISMSSPVLDRAEPLAEVSDDMVRRARGQYPDMGALEAQGRPRPARPR
jgi:hypothetical protein